MLSVIKLKQYIKSVYFGNISKASLDIGLKRDTLTKIVNEKRNAGYKTLSILKDFCKKKNLPETFFLLNV